MPVTPIGQQPVLPNGTTVPLVPATRVGELIFCSGALGVDANFQLVEGGIAAQTKAAIANLQAALAQAGATLSDVAKTTVFGRTGRGRFSRKPTFVRGAANGGGEPKSTDAADRMKVCF